MPFKKGEGGRPRGAKNKTTVALKEMVLQALERAGGIRYLKKQAKENPSAFLTLVGKVLPLQIGPDGNSSGKLVIEWQQSQSE